jgi:hypothetical protein
MAVVEATILFPIIIMIFAGLVLLSMYLPQRAILQRATQITATAISTARSDAWITYDGNSFSTPARPPNVYVSFFKAFASGDESAVAERSVRRLENQFTLLTQMEGYDYSGQFADGASEGGWTGLRVTYSVHNLVIYKEIIVTAERRIPTPVNLSFIGFPETIDLTVTSIAVVHNGDEFIRNIDIVVDFVKWLDEKLGISDKFEGIFEGIKKVEGFLNI